MESHIDHLIRTSFPHPVAAAWHRVALSTSSADRIKRLLACLEVLVRLQCVLMLPDYLRGEPDDAVEKTIERMDRPALGHWVQLMRSVIRALEGREPAPFMPETLGWYLTKGRPSDAAKRLDALVAIRNEEAHGRALSGSEQDERADELVAELRTLLGEMSFLGQYRPFRILSSTLSRQGGFSGLVQFLVGAVPQAEPVQASWPARLFEGSVYLANPAGDEVLELSPFMAVIYDAGPKEDRVFLAAATHKGKGLLLKNDSTGTTETVNPQPGEGEADVWSAARSSPALWQKNRGASACFAADLPPQTTDIPLQPGVPRYHVHLPDGSRKVLALPDVLQRLSDAPDATFAVWQPGWTSWRNPHEVAEIAQALLDAAPPVPGAEPPPLEPEELPPVEIETLPLPGRTFEMAPGRRVTLARDVQISAPISRALWNEVMRDAAREGDGGEPVDRISWLEAVSFCIALSARCGLPSPYRYSEHRPIKEYSIDDIGRMLREVVPFKKVPAILNHFGTEALGVMQFAPERLAEVPGIGEKTAAGYARKWDPDKYFVRDVIWDRGAPGFRLPTEAEWAAAVPEPEPGRLEWVWCADPGPSYQPQPVPLEEGDLTDPATDEGPRRIVRGAAGRAARLPEKSEAKLGLRVIREG